MQLARSEDDLDDCSLALTAARAVMPALALLKVRPFLDAATVFVLLYLLAWAIWEAKCQPFAYLFPPNK